MKLQTFSGDIVNHFIDTNVIIGYIFVLDYLNQKSHSYLQFNNNNYFYSQNVKNEVEEVFKIKSRNYQEFFLRIIKFLNCFSDYDLIDEINVHHKINSFDDKGKLKNKDMHLALKIIWDKLSFDSYHDAFEVKKAFDDLTNNFQSRHVYKKDALFNDLNLVPNHTMKDKKILKLIKKENLRDNLLHGQDENILFDANEFCKNNKELNLKFATADQDFLKAINILESYLCIKEVINILEFSNS